MRINVLSEQIHRFMLGVKKRPMRFMCYQLDTPANDVFHRRAEAYEMLWWWGVQNSLLAQYRGFKHENAEAIETIR